MIITISGVAGSGKTTIAKLLAKKLDLRIKEIPVEWENNPNTHVKFLEAVNMIFELLKIRFNTYDYK